MTRDSQRDHGMDLLRATAMLLGVLYHSLAFAGFTGAAPGFGPAGEASADSLLQDWLHSFRMPLFFMVAGFFGRMMLCKYGTWTYLTRRWRRLGLPLLIGIFTVAPLYEWSLGEALGRPPFLPSDPSPGSGRLGPPPFAGPAISPRSAALSEMLFGWYARYFTLYHLWFLWYLLLFVTAAPWLSRALACLLRDGQDLLDAVFRRAIRLGLAPLAAGLAALPLLMLSSQPRGCSHELVSAMWLPFPDFLLWLEPAMAFYLLYYLLGWWLYRLRDTLSDLRAGCWLYLAAGLALHAGFLFLSGTYSQLTNVSHDQMSRCGGEALYACGQTYTVFGLIGLFERSFSNDSLVGRYLSDTALWVYLIHPPILVWVLLSCAPLGCPWWVQAPAATAVTMWVALLMFEFVVRPTPLMAIFGPAGAGRAGSPARPAPETETHLAAPSLVGIPPAKPK